MDSGIWFDTDMILIGGRWLPPAKGERLDPLNPSDRTPLARIAHGTAEDLDDAVSAARAARNGAWGRLTAAERGHLMLALSRLILERTEDLARIEALNVANR